MTIESQATNIIPIEDARNRLYQDRVLNLEDLAGRSDIADIILLQAYKQRVSDLAITVGNILHDHPELIEARRYERIDKITDPLVVYMAEGTLTLNPRLSDRRKGIHIGVNFSKQNSDQSDTWLTNFYVVTYNLPETNAFTLNATNSPLKRVTAKKGLIKETVIDSETFRHLNKLDLLTEESVSEYYLTQNVYRRKKPSNKFTTRLRRLGNPGKEGSSSHLHFEMVAPYGSPYTQQVRLEIDYALYSNLGILKYGASHQTDLSKYDFETRSSEEDLLQSFPRTISTQNVILNLAENEHPLKI